VWVERSGAVSSDGGWSPGSLDAGQACWLPQDTAYRTFALDHPGQFASTLLPPRSDLDELATANETLIDVFALQRTRASPSDHDAEYRYLLDALQRGLLNPTDEAED